MGIQHVERDGCGAYVVSESCPFCGSNLEGERSLADHIQNTCQEAA